MAASQSILRCVFHVCTAISCIVCVIPFDCSFVLAQSFLQRSSSFSNVHTFTFSAGYLLHNSSFLPCWLWLLCLYQDFAECSSRREGCPNPKLPTHPFNPLTDASDIGDRRCRKWGLGWSWVSVWSGGGLSWFLRVGSISGVRYPYWISKSHIRIKYTTPSSLLSSNYTILLAHICTMTH